MSLLFMWTESQVVKAAAVVDHRLAEAVVVPERASAIIR
jgi:hypothetical protein